jgi:hypothetical protein
MRIATLLALPVVLLFTSFAFAQPPAAEPPLPEVPSDVASLLQVATTEWMITTGPAWGVALFHSIPGHNYLLASASWGRILTAPKGPGALRGSFQWAFEVVPIYGQYAPDDNYGIGLTPIVWRWNFAPRGRISTYAELAGGTLFTRDPVPRDTTTANFTAHLGYGIRYFLRPRQALAASYRFHHISNGNRLERNPGVNAHVFQFGWTLMRPRP